MSIEQLKSDAAAVVAALPSGPLISAADMAAYMKNNLLPLFADLVDELGEMDAAVAELVTGSVDVLHTDSSTVFRTLIEGGTKIIADLQARISELGGAVTGELAQAIKEWASLAQEGREILEDVTFADADDEDDGDDEDEDENPDDEESTKADEKK
jgi:hypothetical protein